MEILRIFDILDRYQDTHPTQEVALAGKIGKEWIKYSPSDYFEMTQNISYALIKLGIEPGDKVGIISTNRPEWNMMDMGILQIGAISVPIYPTITANEYLFILNHAEVKFVIIEGAELLEKIISIKDSLPLLEHLYTFVNRESYPHFTQLVELGKDNPNPEELQKRKANIKPEDCSSIVYTSGTTGVPKGVMLSHSNIVNQILNLRQTPAKWSKTSFSFLPLCHAYERMLVFLYQYLGMSVYYAQNLGTIGDNIKEVTPTMMSAVPEC